MCFHSSVRREPKVWDIRLRCQLEQVHLGKGWRFDQWFIYGSLPPINLVQPQRLALYMFVILVSDTSVILTQTCTVLVPLPLASSIPKPKTSRYKSRIHTHCSLRPSHLTLFATSAAPNRRAGSVCAVPMLLSLTTSFWYIAQTFICHGSVPKLVEGWAWMCCGSGVVEDRE